jgi:uncharacterized sulfatase
MNGSKRQVFPAGFVVRVFALLLIYTLTRALFLLFNQPLLNSFSAADLARAFALGFRFDAWVVAATMLPLFLLEVWLWKSRSENARRITSSFSILVFVIHAFFIFCELADTQYFRFTGRRTTLAILKLSSDGFEQTAQLLKNFWIVPVLSVFFISFLAVVWRKTRNMARDTQGKELAFQKMLMVLLAGIILGVLGLRGGLQTKPISPAHAMLLGQSQLAGLALSTSFQLTHSTENRQLPVINFFADERQVRTLLEVPRKRHAPVELKDYNVVILVVESLSLEYMGYKGINTNYVPFISSLSARSLFFDHAYANGRTSIEAFPSILASLPSMVGDPFITSQYSSVKMLSLGHELTQRGYSTEFFHGCNNGSMYIDSMAQLFGFKKFFGRYDYPNGDRDYDGSWGIYDEPFLQFAVDRMNQIKAPFAVGIFTLSSHNPYKIPAHLREKFPDGRQPFHKSLGYADYAIQKFFESAARQPWYKNTLFILTGDHTADLESPVFMSEQGNYRVPLLFFDPSGRLQAGISHRIVQHTDIFPSVLDLLGIDMTDSAQPLLPFGQSVFTPEGFARAANRAGDWFWYQEGRSVVRIPADGGSSFHSQQDENIAHAAHASPIQLVDIQSDTLTLAAPRAPHAEEDEGIVKRAKAYLQFFNNRMTKNSLLEP